MKCEINAACTGYDYFPIVGARGSYKFKFGSNGVVVADIVVAKSAFSGEALDLIARGACVKITIEVIETPLQRARRLLDNGKTKEAVAEALTILEGLTK